MFLSLLPLWIYLAGIVPAIAVGGVVVGVKRARDARAWDGEDLFFHGVGVVLAGGLWPPVAPVFLAMRAGERRVAAQRHTAEEQTQLDRIAEREGLAVLPPRRDEPLNPFQRYS